MNPVNPLDPLENSGSADFAIKNMCLHIFSELKSKCSGAVCGVSKELWESFRRPFIHTEA